VYVSHRWNAHKLQHSIAGYANDEEAAAKLYLLLRFQRGTRLEAQASQERAGCTVNVGGWPLTLLHLQVFQGLHVLGGLGGGPHCLKHAHIGQRRQLNTRQHWMCDDNFASAQTARSF